MKKNGLVLLVVVTFLAATITAAAQESGNLIKNHSLRKGNDGLPAGWTTWTPSPGLAPESRLVSLEGQPALMLKSNQFADYGKWITWVDGIEPEKFYRFQISQKTSDIGSVVENAVVILSWHTSVNDSKAALQRDYVDQHNEDLPWRLCYRTIKAPANAKAVKIELVLRNTAAGTVWWKSPSLVNVLVPARTARLATTWIKPVGSVEGNLRLMTDMMDRIGPEKPDVVLFSETVATWGVPLPLSERAQPIPGPATRALSEKARQYNTYIVTSLYESDNGLVYNTAVLIDREGRIAGKYRKVHLPMVEGEDGVTPGNEYHVFETDFGKVGLMICWDNWFPETARALRLKGAEILMLPIAGDGDPRHWDAVSRARAMDNGVYLVSSPVVGRNPGSIINPAGEVLAETQAESGFALAEVDLNQEFRLKWLSVGPGEGEPQSLYVKERRPETYQPIVRE